MMIRISCFVVLLSKARPITAQTSKSSTLVEKEPSVVDFITNTPYLTIFSSLLNATNRFPTNATVFAPSDESFRGLDAILDRFLNNDQYSLHLQDLVDFHIVRGRVKSGEPSVLSTLAIESITLTGGNFNRMVGSPRQQFSKILHEDMEQSDGLVNTIDRPLLPFWFDYEVSSVVDHMNEQFGNQFTIFKKMMGQAGLVNVRPGTTLLMPVDNGIPKILEERLFDPRNSDLLATVVRHHVLPKVMDFRSLGPVAQVDTLDGGNVRVVKTKSGLSFGGASASNYVLVKDGIAFPINSLLLPPLLDDSVDTKASTALLDMLALLSSTKSIDLSSVFVPTQKSIDESTEAGYLSTLRDREEYQLHREGLVGYHTTSIPVDQLALTGLETVPMTAGGSTQMFRIDGKLLLRFPNNGEARVVGIDGEFMLIDKPLLPAWAMWTPWSYLKEFEKRFPFSRYSYFIELVVKANMESLLQTDRSLTVFAPENDAISWGIRFYFLYYPDTVSALRDLLHYHIVPEIVNYKNVPNKQLPTLFGDHTLSVSTANGDLRFDNVRASSYSLTGRNSILYRMEEVLIPPSVYLPPWVAPEGITPGGASSPDLTHTRFQDIPITV